MVLSLVASVLLLAVGVVILSALLGSVLIQSFTTVDEVTLSPQEQKCQQIANEAYIIHVMYPNSNPDDLPSDDQKRLLYLDDLWMTQCVAVLSAESVFSIVNNVERNVSFGE